MERSVPANDLQRLQRQAAAPGCATIAWERAAGPMAVRLGISPQEAERYVLETVSSLSSADFVQQVIMRERAFDVYALLSR